MATEALIFEWLVPSWQTVWEGLRGIAMLEWVWPCLRRCVSGGGL